MLDYLLELSSSEIKTVVDPARLRPSDVLVLHGDAGKFRAATGWEPRYSFEQTMQDLLNYWREKVADSTRGKVKV
jgi:GDP-4-dehydro-6-deoxy-D-mannose reductase